MSAYTDKLIEDYKSETELYGLVVDAILATKILDDVSEVKQMAYSVVKAITNEK